MKKKLSLACLLACTVLCSGATLPQAKGSDNSTSVELQLNGRAVTFSSMPRLIDNTLMVPLRDLSEALGVQVEWNEQTQTATAKKDDRQIGLTLGNTQALRQGRPIQLDTAPRMEEGKLYVPVRFFSESFDFSVFWDGPNRSVSIVDTNKALPTVGTVEHLQQLLQESSSPGFAANFAGDAAVAVEDNAVAVTGAAVPAAAVKEKATLSAPVPASPEAKPSFSGTNVQVEGVDESDIIKTDGTYIYQVNRNRVVITAAYPADQMKVVQSLSFEDANFRAKELYIDNKHMVVIGSTYYPLEHSGQPAANDGSVPAAQSTNPVPEMKKMIVTIRPQRTTTKAIVYDLGDRSSNLKVVREMELEGSYVSSRKVGSSLYMVTNKGVSFYPMLRMNQAVPADDTAKLTALASSAPAYKDSAIGKDFISMSFDDIRYFPESVKSSYLMIGGINLEQPGQKMSVQSYLGSGNQVYASQKNLYVVTREYTPAPAPAPVLPQDGAAVMKRPASPAEENSVIYKFGMDEGALRYNGRGKVPGHSINQYAMDENNGYFRIATTQGQLDSNNRYITSNSMYVLDESLKTAGKIDDIAPGEQIYSVRYTGDRAYMVTFRTVDPLFVIDLKQPQAPKIVGKLKIPGYSNYLHPFDENHVIGFGKDTKEVSNSAVNAGAEIPQTTAYYQGMKMALFDVSDVEHPKELYVENIGDRGTDSELLHNPKALLYSKEQNLLAFPVTVMEIGGSSSNSGSASSKANEALRYGSFTFQGAYVYKLNLAEGFKLQGKITHLTQDDYNKSGQLGAAYQRNIHRILSIENTLYTSSEQLLKATDLTTFKDVGSVTIP